MKEFVYIYNAEQVKYYINNCNLKIVDMGTGNKGDAFIKFKNDEEYRIAFASWCKLNK